jgi:hypothetical protein
MAKQVGQISPHGGDKSAVSSRLNTQRASRMSRRRCTRRQSRCIAIADALMTLHDIYAR